MAKTLQNNVLNYLGVRATNPPEVVQLPSAPTSAFTNYDLFTMGVFNNSLYFLSSFSGSGANWILLGSGAGAVEVINSTANQINASKSGTTYTLSLSSTMVLPGTLTVAGTTNINTTGSAVTSIGTGGTGAVNIGNATGNTAVTGSLTASTSLTATLGDITATNGNLSLGTAGNKLKIATGANASMGTATLNGLGTVTVATTAVKSTSTIFLTVNTPSGATAPGVVSAPVASIVDGVQFVINSSDVADDASTVNWLIIN